MKIGKKITKNLMHRLTITYDKIGSRSKLSKYENGQYEIKTIINDLNKYLYHKPTTVKNSKGESHE